jgi:DNA-binding SARP family transcriptional activator/tetratricopeptide (TPR) repeat protein
VDDGLFFGVLGPLTLERVGEPVELPRSGVLRAVLGALLLAEGTPLPIERLCAAVWTSRHEVSRGAVHVAISRLRKFLAGVAIAHQNGGYRLELPAEAVDLGRFRALSTAAAATDEPQRRCDLLREALALRRGPVLDGLEQIEVDTPSVRAAEGLVRDTALTFGELAVQLGRAGEAVGPLTDLAAARPFDEPLHACMIAALAAADQPAAALLHYDGLRERLAEDIGVAPSEPVQRAYLDVLAEDHELAKPTGDEPVEPVKPAPDVPAQLPIAAAGFTGRAEHLDRLTALLDEHRTGLTPSTTVITIDGMAGVGKTALAVHWAHTVRDQFADGQLYVRLTDTIAPAAVLFGFLLALGEPPAAIPSDADLAAPLFRTRAAGRKLLIVLDNAEDTEQIRPLLPASPCCVVVVTSRNRLASLVALDGAHRVALEPLTSGEARRLLAEVLGPTRVAAEPAATDELVRACGGLPLALRIAAAKLAERPTYQVADYVGELDRTDRLAALEVPGVDDVSVRAAFDLSYASLKHADQDLFSLVGLFPGRVITGPAAAVLAGRDVAGTRVALDRLAAANLVTVTAPDRYVLHDLLYVYAAQCAQQMPAAERHAAVGRYLRWCLRNAAAAATLLHRDLPRLPLPAECADAPLVGFDTYADALGWLDDERTNLVAVVALAAESGAREIACVLADMLRRYLWLRSGQDDWSRVAGVALEAATADGYLRGQAAAHLSLADNNRRHGDLRAAVHHLDAAVALCEEDGWLDGLAGALGPLGTVWWMLGDLPAAARHYERALQVNERLGSSIVESTNLGSLGMVYWAIGDLPRSAEHHRRALALDRQTGNRVNESHALGNLGETCHALGELDEAFHALTDALALRRELGDRGGQAEAFKALAALQRDRGDLSGARECAEAGLAIAQQIDEPRLEAEVRTVLASVARRQRRYAEAADHDEIALRLAARTQAGYAEVAARIGLALTHLRQDDAAAAIEQATRAAALAERAGYRQLAAQAVTALAEIHLAGGDQVATGKAVDEASRAYRMHRATGSRYGQARALLVLAAAATSAGRGAVADRYRCWAERILTNMGAVGP